MNWLLLLIEIAVAVATFHVLHGIDGYKRQSTLVRILIAGVILFVLFTLARFLLPGVPAL